MRLRTLRAAIQTGVGEVRQEARQFGPLTADGRIRTAELRVVRRHQLPGHAVVRGNEHAGAVAERVVDVVGDIGTAVVLGFEEVIEVQRRAILRDRTGQREAAGDERPEGPAREVVGVADGRVAAQVVMQRRRQDTELGVHLRFVSQVGQRVRLVVLVPLFEAEMEARATLALVLISVRTGAGGCDCQVDLTRSAAVVRRFVDPVPDVGAPLHRRVPKVEVQRRERRADRTGATAGHAGHRHGYRVGDAVTGRIEDLTQDAERVRLWVDRRTGGQQWQRRHRGRVEGVHRPGGRDGKQGVAIGAPFDVLRTVR